ncbi:unnamed protein product [Ectocarpus sp. CCAP 1310/34]|nr:unnamed protein product [Ectocarpus sp. CCAP 1310/34]
MSSSACLSLEPPHLFTHGTADTLSPLIMIVCPGCVGFSPTNIWTTQHVIIIPSNSSVLIVIALASLASAFLFSSAVNAG